MPEKRYQTKTQRNASGTGQEWKENYAGKDRSDGGCEKDMLGTKIYEINVVMRDQE